MVLLVGCGPWIVDVGCGWWIVDCVPWTVEHGLGFGSKLVLEERLDTCTGAQAQATGDQ